MDTESTNKAKRIYPKRPYKPRKDIALSRIAPGHYEGHGFVLVECTGRWRLAGNDIGIKKFMIRCDAVKFVEEWLDKNKPDWRQIDPSKKRYNPVNG